MSNIFANLDAFRAHCGEPTMELDACTICKAMPAYCRRFVKGGDTQEDTIPSEAERLVDFLPGIQNHRGEVKRCPTCRRLYFYDSEYEFIYGGSEDTWTYERLEVDRLFRHEWSVHQRLPNKKVSWVHWQDFFPVALVQVDGWHVLDDRNQLTRFTEDVARELVAENPQHGLDDIERAKRFAYIIQLAGEHPAKTVHYFSTIGWKKPLTDEEKMQIADLEAACGKMESGTESLGDRIAIRSWVIMNRKLICRVTTVFPDGRFTREDAVIGENIPVA